MTSDEDDEDDKGFSKELFEMFEDLSSEGSSEEEETKVCFYSYLYMSDREI